MSDTNEEGLSDEGEISCDADEHEVVRINYGMEVIHKLKATSESVEGVINGYFSPQKSGKKRRRPGARARQQLKDLTVVE